jgi:hypothetical protein
LFLLCESNSIKRANVEKNVKGTNVQF